MRNDMRKVISAAPVSDTDLQKFEAYMHTQLDDYPISMCIAGISAGISGSIFCNNVDLESLKSYVDCKGTTFSERLFELIYQKKIDEKKLFLSIGKDAKYLSKVRCNKQYHPSLSIACELAIEMRLSITETEELLGLAGYSLMRDTLFNKIIRFAIKEKKYNVCQVQLFLEKYDLSFNI